LGSEISYRLAHDIDLNARAAWAHRLHGDAGTITATALGLSQVMPGPLGDADWAEGGVGASWQIAENTVIMTEINGRSGETQDPAISVMAGINVRF